MKRDTDKKGGYVSSINLRSFDTYSLAYAIAVDFPNCGRASSHSDRPFVETASASVRL